MPCPTQEYRLAFYGNIPFVGVLQRIGQQCEDNLLYPLPVSLDSVTELLKSLEGGLELNSFGICLQLLNLDYFVDGFYEVELAYVLLELPCSDLAEVDDVIHEEQ